MPTLDNTIFYGNGLLGLIFDIGFPSVPIIYLYQCLTTNINTYNPGKMVFHEWINIFKDLKKKCSVKAKLLYVFGPPGWSHDGSTKTSSQLRAELKE